MYKISKTAGLLAIIACVAAAYSWAAVENDIQEGTTVMQSMTGRQAQNVPGKKDGKRLVVYFSVPETDAMDASSGASRVVSGGQVMGNTRYVASIISEATGGDLFEIKTVHTYPASHKALIDAAKEEADSKARPKLATHIKNLKDYDVVFVGFPNWWYDMPMPLYTFFDEYDFKGKTIIPFCTHGGSRFSEAIKTIREMEGGAIVMDGYAISRDRVPESRDGILKWLDRIGMRK